MKSGKLLYNNNMNSHSSKKKKGKEKNSTKMKGFKDMISQMLEFFIGLHTLTPPRTRLFYQLSKILHRVLDPAGLGM